MADNDYTRRKSQRVLEMLSDLERHGGINVQTFTGKKTERHLLAEELVGKGLLEKEARASDYFSYSFTDKGRQFYNELVDVWVEI
jgi:predicted transcriptional regulator|tara:strand:+ start:261 stop:515 length:255 start_codon:yes stop_codon:yes gene_type:complete